MAKVRISTTVDEALLERARRFHGQGTDASLLEAALTSLLREHRSAEVDQAYQSAYRESPADLVDEWGSLSDFLNAAARQ
ncbi:antitoxin MazE5 [Citricoccus sp. NPDC079358]|uniref:antitoxin MazE5 n=1 Tax=Citricoccus sp. NPDC079358 TaxID=3154653 RepID=UPI00344C29BD